MRTDFDAAITFEIDEKSDHENQNDQDYHYYHCELIAVSINSCVYYARCAIICLTYTVKALRGTL